jgi:hypothetical protein
MRHESIPNVLIHEQYVKIHVKCAKIKQTKINMKTIKQAKLSPTRQGVPQWSRHPIVMCTVLNGEAAS